jgi:hypothetical protein
MSFKILPDDSIQLSGPIYVGTDIPLDARYLVATSGDLASIPIKYAGMQVYAEDDKKLFLLQDVATDSWLDLSATGEYSAGGSNLTELPNAGIFISGATGIGTTYNTEMPDAVNSVAIGGLTSQPASYWKSKNFVEIFDELLFPTVLPSIGSQKGLSLSVSSPVGVLEVGTTHNRSFTATFQPGTIKDGDGSTNSNSLVGDATSYTFSGTNITTTTQSSNSYSENNVAIILGSNAWYASAIYASGTGAYFDNKFVERTNLDSQRAEGSIGPVAGSTANGVYPWYVFKSSTPIDAAAMKAAIEAPTPPAGLQKFVASSDGTLSVNYNLSNQYLAIAHPASSTAKTKYFVSTLDSGGITVVFNLSTANGVTTSNWSNINYSVYSTKSAKTETRPTIELRNS